MIVGRGSEYTCLKSQLSYILYEVGSLTGDSSWQKDAINVNYVVVWPMCHSQTRSLHVRVDNINHFHLPKESSLYVSTPSHVRKLKKRRGVKRDHKTVSTARIMSNKAESSNLYPSKFKVPKFLKNNFSFAKSLRPATLFKKRLWHRFFPVKFAKFLRTPFLQNASDRLLLKKYIFFSLHVYWPTLYLRQWRLSDQRHLH